MALPDAGNDQSAGWLVLKEQVNMAEQIPGDRPRDNLPQHESRTSEDTTGQDSATSDNFSTSDTKHPARQHSFQSFKSGDGSNVVSPVIGEDFQLKNLSSASTPPRKQQLYRPLSWAQEIAQRHSYVICLGSAPFLTESTSVGFRKLVGYGEGFCRGKTLSYLQGSATSRDIVRKLMDGIHAGEEISVTVLNYKANRSMFVNHLTVIPISSDPSCSVVTHFLGVLAEDSNKPSVDLFLKDALPRGKRRIMVAVAEAEKAAKESSPKARFREKVLAARKAFATPTKLSKSAGATSEEFSAGMIFSGSEIPGSRTPHTDGAQRPKTTRTRLQGHTPRYFGDDEEKSPVEDSSAASLLKSRATVDFSEETASPSVSSSPPGSARHASSQISPSSSPRFRRRASYATGPSRKDHDATPRDGSKHSPSASSPSLPKVQQEARSPLSVSPASLGSSPGGSPHLSPRVPRIAAKVAADAKRRPTSAYEDEGVRRTHVHPRCRRQCVDEVQGEGFVTNQTHPKEPKPPTLPKSGAPHSPNRPRSGLPANRVNKNLESSREGSASPRAGHQTQRSTKHKLESAMDSDDENSSTCLQRQQSTHGGRDVDSSDVLYSESLSENNSPSINQCQGSVAISEFPSESPANAGSPEVSASVESESVDSSKRRITPRQKFQLAVKAAGKFQKPGSWKGQAEELPDDFLNEDEILPEFRFGEGLRKPNRPPLLDNEACQQDEVPDGAFLVRSLFGSYKVYHPVRRPLKGKYGSSLNQSESLTPATLEKSSGL